MNLNDSHEKWTSWKKPWFFRFQLAASLLRIEWISHFAASQLEEPLPADTGSTFVSYVPLSWIFSPQVPFSESIRELSSACTNQPKMTFSMNSGRWLGPHPPFLRQVVLKSKNRGLSNHLEPKTNSVTNSPSVSIQDPFISLNHLTSWLFLFHVVFVKSQCYSWKLKDSGWSFQWNSSHSWKIAWNLHFSSITSISSQSSGRISLRPVPPKWGWL